MKKIEKIKYLIIGNSAGGIGAAEAIHEVDKVGTIAIVSDEPYSAYSRPLISEFLANRCSLEKMLFRPADFYDKNNILAIMGRKTTELNTDKHAIKLDDSRTITWDKLLLATGGLPIVPQIAGINMQGVFTFTKLDDAKAIDKFLRSYNRSNKREVRAVVIGGGLIGVSVTEALVRRGIKVTIIEMKERILNTILDKEASALEAASLKEAGVKIITGRTVDKLGSYVPGEVTSVTLDDGHPVPCGLVIIAIGVQPRIEIASGTGIKTNRGIVVDRHMATSSPDVYACGDVVESYDFTYGNNRVTPIWPNAYTGGRVAGLNMAGVPTKYQGSTALNSMKYFGTNIVSAGIVIPPDDSYETISIKKDGIYRKVVIKGGQISGIVFAGDIDKAGIIYNLMKDRVNVSSFKDILVADDFGLASLPEEIWRPRLAVLPSPLVSPRTRAEQPKEALVGE